MRRAAAQRSRLRRNASVGLAEPVRISLALWHELFEDGQIDYHPVFPGRPGYAARRIETQEDVRDVIALLRLNYDRAVDQHGLPEGA